MFSFSFCTFYQMYNCANEPAYVHVRIMLFKQMCVHVHVIHAARLLTYVTTDHTIPPATVKLNEQVPELPGVSNIMNVTV